MTSTIPYGHIGAVATNKHDYGAVASVTPDKDGWMVVTTNSGSSVPTAEPVLRVLVDSIVIAHFVDVKASSATGCWGVPVKKGVTYSFQVFRTTIQNVSVYS